MVPCYRRRPPACSAVEESAGSVKGRGAGRLGMEQMESIGKPLLVESFLARISGMCGGEKYIVADALLR